MSTVSKKTTLEHTSLPQLLFRQCHLNCVDSEAFTAESAAEKLCITNCQAKTYAAFDMYWSMRKFGAHNSQKVSEIIDISGYTGMEVEHAHDTSTVLLQKHGVHV